jgi:hypothetical protein
MPTFACRRLVLPVVLLLCQTVSARAQAPTPAKTSAKPSSRDADDAKEREKRLDEMRILAGRLSFEEPGDKRSARHLIVEKPLLHYTDADRGIFDGTLWAYGREGRPVAVLEMYCGREENPRFRHATTATCDRLVKLVGAPGIDWAPAKSAVSWGELKSDAPPAADPAARLRQIKSLAKRFDIYQIFEPAMQREELRLLVQPLHRYSDRQQKVRDGVLFAFALGTNPEALLFLEARDETDGRMAWHYGYARRGSAASLHGLLDGREVWNVPALERVTSQDPHVHFFRPLAGDPVLTIP